MVRSFLTICAIVFALIIPCVWAETTITVCGFGGSYNKAIEDAIVKPFTQATGIKVIVTAWPDYAKMVGQVTTAISNGISWRLKTGSIIEGSKTGSLNVWI